MAMTEYSKQIHTKANLVGRKLIEKFNADKDILLNENIDPTPEEQLVIDEKTTDFAISVMQLLAAEDVLANYATFSIDKIIASLTGLKQFVEGQLRVYEDEYLSRSYGVKNEEGKFRKEAITIGQLMVKLDEIQKATGGNKNDFYNETAPEMPTDGSVPSPFVE